MKKQAIKKLPKDMTAEELSKYIIDGMRGENVYHVDFSANKQTQATKDAIKSKVLKVSRISTAELRDLTAKGFIVIVT